MDDLQCGRNGSLPKRAAQAAPIRCRPVAATSLQACAHPRGCRHCRGLPDVDGLVVRGGGKHGWVGWVPGHTVHSAAVALQLQQPLACRQVGWVARAWEAVKTPGELALCWQQLRSSQQPCQLLEQAAVHASQTREVGRGKRRSTTQPGAAHHIAPVWRWYTYTLHSSEPVSTKRSSRPPRQERTTNRLCLSCRQGGWAGAGADTQGQVGLRAGVVLCLCGIRQETNGSSATAAKLRTGAVRQPPRPKHSRCGPQSVRRAWWAAGCPARCPGPTGAWCCCTGGERGKGTAQGVVMKL